MNCPKCGAEVTTNASFCEYCGQSLENQAPTQNDAPIPEQPQSVPAAPEKKENMLTGIVGALIGAAIGCVAIVLVNMLGYMASICGLILAICTLKGYELLGGKLSVKGMIACVVIMLITPYIADRISWAVVIMQAYEAEGVTFGEAFGVVPVFLSEGVIEMGVYIKDLLMLYLFTLLGGFGTVIDRFKKKK